MELKKVVKKPIITRGGVSGGTGQTSNLRPKPSPKTPPCTLGCPSEGDIRTWIQVISQHEAYNKTLEQALEEAFYIIVDKNPFPAICGRVCPHPCMDECNRRVLEGAVDINALERFVGDFGLEHNLKLKKITDDEQTEKVAVIGAGPAGLSCAYQLARRGYKVTVFEAFPKAGGMMYYGIPPYRLPRDVLQREIERILDLGVELRLGVTVGREIRIEDLRKEYKAIFVSIGAHKGLKLGVSGEDVPNVFTGTEFLNKMNSGQKVEVGDKVLVIGGGDTAIDAARVARRLGADVTILYRRTRNEMPAIKPEIEGAEEEGVKIELLTAPAEVVVENGRAVGLKCIRMQLGEPDKSGRPRPIPIPGSEFFVPATAIITAISQEPDFDPLPEIRSGKDWVKVDEYGRTAIEGIFAGGDVVNLALVTTAVGQGRIAAEAIDCYIKGKPLPVKPPKAEVIKPERMKIAWYKPAQPNKRPHLAPEARLANPDAEIEGPYTVEQMMAEAKRCMSCGMCFDCETCWMFCQNSVFVKLPKGQHYGYKLELCNGCKKCAEECPCGYIDMV